MFRFADEVQLGQPIVPQIEAWAEEQKIELAKPGWKVELAKRVKHHLLDGGVNSVPQEYLERWTKRFGDFQTVRAGASKKTVPTSK
jgi:hypothetical protein